ncbi:TolC family protein [Myxococcaceae bacterium JPH2]|nr:TolC family protein [Myxococcaceae bacterium JPH2]
MSALLVAALLAATPITLEEARTQGRQNTQALQTLLDLTSAEQDVRFSRSALLPQVGLNASASLDYVGRRKVVQTAPTIGPDGSLTFSVREIETPSNTSDSYSLGFGLTQLIYDRARWKQVEQSGANREAARGQAEEQADTSEMEAIRRFFTLYLSQATLDVLQANVQRSEEQLERARALFQAGRVGKSEEIAARVNLGNDRISVVQRQTQLVSDQAQLSVWLAQPGTTDLQAVAPGVLTQEPTPAPPLESSIEAARQHRALLRVLQQQVRSAELQRSIASSGYLPRLSLDGRFNHGNPDPGPFVSDPGLGNTFTGSVILSWDLFNGFATDAQSKRADAQLRRVELGQAQTIRELEAEVRRAHQALDGQIASSKLAAENREAASQGLSLANERFRAGAGSTLDVRDAQLKLTQAELSMLQSRIDVEIARYALLRATGLLNSGDAR